MKAYKILALLEKVEKLKAGDKRVLINGFPCKVDFRMVADDLFEDVVSSLKDTIEELEQVKNCSIADVVVPKGTLSNLDEAIKKAKPNMDKIKDVDKHLDSIR